MFNIRITVKKFVEMVYDNRDIQYCKQHINGLYTRWDKKRKL